MSYWYVYISQAKTGRLYVGISTNPKVRLVKHNLGKGARFVINQGPLQLLYTSKPFLNKSTARKREIQIKKWSHNKEMKLTNAEWV